MDKNGIITKIHLFYIVVMDNDYKTYKLIRKKNLTVDSMITFNNKDVLKLNVLSLVTIITVILLTTAGIYGYTAHANANEDEIYFFYDKENESYMLKTSNTLKINKISKYVNGEYKNADNENTGSNISKYVNGMIKNFKKETVIAMTYIQVNNDDYQSKIDYEISIIQKTIQNWNTNNTNKVKLIIVKGSHKDLETAMKKSLPIGKYIIFKNSQYINKRISENDLYSITLSQLLDLKSLPDSDELDELGTIPLIDEVTPVETDLPVDNNLIPTKINESINDKPTVKTTTSSSNATPTTKPVTTISEPNTTILPTRTIPTTSTTPTTEMSTTSPTSSPTEMPTTSPTTSSTEMPTTSPTEIIITPIPTELPITP